MTPVSHFNLRSSLTFLVIVAGLPTTAFAVVVALVTHQSFLFTLLLVLTALAFTIAIGSTGARLLVTSRVSSLVETAEKVKAGDLDARTGISSGRDELSTLAKSFDQIVQEQLSGLRYSESRYRTLLETIPGMAYIYVSGPEDSSILSYISPQIEKILGFSPEEWTSDPELWSRQIHPDDRERVLAMYQKSCNLGALFRAEYRILAHDGRVVWVLDEANIKRGKTADAQVMQGMMLDITARKMAEEALRNSEESYRTMFTGNSLPMWVYELETLKILEVNDAAILRYGYSRQEFLNMCITDIRSQDDVPRVVDDFAKQRPDQPLALEWRHRLRSGEVVDVQVMTHQIEFAGRGAVLVVAEEITERKRAEQELRESEKRFRAIFEGAAIGVALVDMEGRIVKGNRTLQEMLEYTNEELRTKRFSDLVHPEDIKGNQLLFNELAIGSRANYQIERRVYRKDGEPVVVKLTVSVLRDGKTKPEFAIAMLENITERKHAQEQSKQQLERLAGLRNIDMAINGSLDLRITLSVILEQLTSQLHVDAADVLLFNPHSQVLEYAAGRGFRNDAITKSRVRLGEGPAGRAALHRHRMTVHNLAETGDLTRVPLLLDEAFSTYFAVPLIAKGHVKGVLEIFNRASLETQPEWFDFLEALASQAAIAIDNASMFNDLQHSNVELALAYDTTLEGWSRALDLRDKETEGHTQRVTELTMRLAKAMGVPDAELVHIHRGALLHDIGKMGIPDSILLKPGPLTDAEWEIMRLHPVYAYELLSPITFLRPALDIPYCHHEKWDGTGYPRGLKGEQIPLSARIFAIVDVWDALRSDRPYRVAWPEIRVREHIRSLSGTHFDPRVVDAFLALDLPEIAEASKLQTAPNLEALVDSFRPRLAAGSAG